MFAFADEEGHFGSFTGSRSLTGELSEADIEASAEVVRAELPGWLATLRQQAAWRPEDLRLWATLSAAQRARLTVAGLFSPSELMDPLSLTDMVNEDLHLGVLPLFIEHDDRADAVDRRPDRRLPDRDDG